MTDRQRSDMLEVGRSKGGRMNPGLGIGIFYAIMFVLVLIYLAEDH